MDYVALLLEKDSYQERLRKLEKLEADRAFCRHGFTHLMDVARLAWIRCLEEHLPYEKEEVYLFALLHDIGRVEEIEQGISHAEASAQYAGEILVHIGYPVQGIRRITGAILCHRGRMETDSQADSAQEDFAALMKWADKASRPCFSCEASGQCNWPKEKKNTVPRWQ